MNFAILIFNFVLIQTGFGLQTSSSFLEGEKINFYCVLWPFLTIFCTIVVIMNFMDSPIISRSIMRCPIMSSPITRSPIMRCPIMRCPIIRNPIMRSPIMRSTNGNNYRKRDHFCQNMEIII